MSPQDITYEVQDRVLAMTGKPVLATADPSLKLLATSTAARGMAPAHLIRYNPSAEKNADYLICFQCGFLLRQFNVPASERRDVGPTWHGRKEVEQLIRDHGRQPGNTDIPKNMRDGFRDQIYDGLIKQLRSVPVGLRVDNWLAKEFPEIIPQQREMTDRQMKENLPALGPEIRRLAPAKVINANVSMNAAFAGFWANHRDDPMVVTPYKAAGFSMQGDELLEIFHEVPSDASMDLTLMDRWGKLLGLTGWYEFIVPSN